MKIQSVSRKVSLGASLLFIMLLAILSYINYSDSKANTTELLVNERTKVTQSAQSLLNTQLGDDIDAIENLAKLIGANNYSNQEVETILKAIENSSRFDLIFVGYQNDGMIIRSNGNSSLPKNEYDPRNELGMKELLKKIRPLFQIPI